MAAGDAAYTEKFQKQVAELQRLGWYHSIELPNGEVIRGLQTPEQLHTRLDRFPIPQDLRGKRVLDIGAWDGWFSFEMERRGASVVAVDAVRCEGLVRARELLGSKVEYIIADVYDLRPADLGQFDIVLFLGVLYHLKHPLLGLERVCALARDMVCVESYATDDGSDPSQMPRLEFYEGLELCGQFDNWTGPNVACILAFCRAAGFARVKFEGMLANRAHVTCHRTWAGTPGNGPAPYIVSVDNSAERSQRFSAAKDDYVSVWFKAAEQGLTPDNVFVEIGGYAARAVLVGATGMDGWQAVAKLPPGISAGWSDVKVRVAESGWSNTVRIGVDVSEEERRQRKASSGTGPDFRIEGASDGKTWEAFRVHQGLDACLSVWVRGLPAECGAGDVAVLLGGRRLPATFLSEVDPAGLRQINAPLPAGVPAGPVETSVAFGETVTAAVAVEILSE